MKRNLSIIKVVCIIAIALRCSASDVQNPIIWDLTGTFEISNTSSYLPGYPYVHSMTIDTVDLSGGDFSGTGYLISDPSYTWTIEGNVSEATLTARLKFTGKGAGYSSDWTATIGSDGTISGSFSDSNDYTGSFVTTDGNAAAAPVAELD